MKNSFIIFCERFFYGILTMLFWICNIVMYPSLILQLAFFILHKLGVGYIGSITLTDPILWIPVMIFGVSFVLSFVVYRIRKHISLEES